MKRKRYQRGSLERDMTAEGMCWYLRFRDVDETGKNIRPRFRVGLQRDLPNKKDANFAADHIRKEFNSDIAKPAPHTFTDLISQYIREEMPKRHATAKGYRNILLNHIKPKWGKLPITEVKAFAVRKWLKELPMSPKSTGHIHDMMKTLFRFAMLWEWIPLSENPMSLFTIEGSSKRTAKPIVLTPEQFGILVKNLPEEPFRTMVILVGCLGLRCSELFGLQWKDFDFIAGTVRIERAMVDGRLGDVKTEHSAKPLPLDKRLCSIVEEHYKRAEFKEPDDWVFASPHTAGEKPYHSYRVQQYKIAPACNKAGLPRIGWHTLRHSYRSWLGQTNAPVGVQKDLMRHADITTTMNVYGDTFVESLRPAHEEVVGMVLQ